MKDNEKLTIKLKISSVVLKSLKSVLRPEGSL